MSDEFKVQPLFGSTSLSTPKAPARLPPPAAATGGDALATALLTGMLSDIGYLKEQMRQQLAVNQHQMELNAAQRSCNEEAEKLFRQMVGLMEAHNKLIDTVLALDERLRAIDGQRSLRDDRPAVAADTAAPVAAAESA